MTSHLSHPRQPVIQEGESESKKGFIFLQAEDIGIISKDKKNQSLRIETTQSYALFKTVP
jgi:hypothetical protein